MLLIQPEGIPREDYQSSLFSMQRLLSFEPKQPPMPPETNRLKNIDARPRIASKTPNKVIAGMYHPHSHTPISPGFGSWSAQLSVLALV
jgi:hypothetical protein